MLMSSVFPLWKNATDMLVGAHRGNTLASSVITDDGRDLTVYCNGAFARI
jgi:hypothetical protein